MSDLKYRELKNVGYKNKDTPKVYFCAHPRDFAIYFNEIKEDILAGHNCSVWYDDEPSDGIDMEMRFADLAGMNLFVVPVTAKLMTEPNLAMDSEIPFAREHNIPVLPLMQEDSLDELFSKKFGNLQYLEKTARYANALSFAGKLKKYLSSVLVGDELNKKIKEAFDAYIFLSYRKKDRKYAQQLMQIIHENDILRDVAIWYDEFLTPGEDYNVNIAASLKKSNIFALAVTPSLLEEGNYIMTTEFPDAKKEGKPIIPVELVETDREKLARVYEDIPECIGAEEREKLANRIAAALCGATLCGRASMPEHKFLIGLAYLGGIDVETNQSRAVSLILEAAESGFAPAAEKLAAMYRTGDGVKHDLYKASRWQSAYTEFCRQKYGSGQSEEDGLEYAEALAVLGDVKEAIVSAECRDMASFSSTEPPQECFEALGLLRALAGEFSSGAAKRKIVSVCYAVADMYFLRRDEGSAETLLLEALEILKGFAREQRNEETVYDVAECYKALAHNRRYGFEIIMKFLSEALRVYEFAYDLFGTAEAARKLAECYDEAKFVCAEMGFKKKEAWEYAQKCLNLMEKISAESGFTEDKRKLANKYISYSGFLFDNNWGIVEEDVRGANYKRAEELLKEVAEKTGEVKDLAAVAELYSDCAKIYESLGDYAVAEDFLLRCVNAYKEFKDKIGAEECEEKICHAYFGLADIYAAQGRDGEAKAYYMLSLGTKKRSKYFYGNFISRCLERGYAECLEAVAKDGYAEYTALVQNESGRMRAKASAWSDFTNTGLRAAELCRKNGMNAAAIAVYEGCGAVCALLEKAVKNRDNTFVLAKIFCSLGELYECEGAAEKALEAFHAAAETAERLIPEYDEAEDREYAAYVYLRRGRIYENTGALESAEEQYLRALKLRMEVYMKESTQEKQAAMTDCTRYLISVYSKQGGIFFRIKKSASLYKTINKWFKA
ncbi:MAG: TIR domain-containing protein [Clostridia bacterium]|nr:TIR domain-containing protein [Clostridia bacterium]